MVLYKKLQLRWRQHNRQQPKKSYKGSDLQIPATSSDSDAGNASDTCPADNNVEVVALGVESLMLQAELNNWKQMVRKLKLRKHLKNKKEQDTWRTFEQL